MWPHEPLLAAPMSALPCAGRKACHKAHTRHNKDTYTDTYKETYKDTYDSLQGVSQGHAGSYVKCKTKYSARCRMLGCACPVAVLPDRAWCLPTFSH